ncbi:hypothetical protein Tco_0155152 [Tanacetum coccineum]
MGEDISTDMVLPFPSTMLNKRIFKIINQTQIDHPVFYWSNTSKEEQRQGKSISLVEAEKEAAAAREVHDTHARIVTKSVPEPARTKDILLACRDTSMYSRMIERKIIGRQPGAGGSNEGTGEIPGVLDESIFADVEDDDNE